MYFIYDPYGNKKEAMSKEETLQAIAQGGETKIFNGSIKYNGVDVSFDYVGELPSEEVLVKLLACGLDPIKNTLIESEITSYLALNTFAIDFLYLDTEVYASNGAKTYLTLIKGGYGLFRIYPRKSDIGYFVKSSEEINNIKHLTQEEFENIQKQEDTIYVVTDGEYVVDSALASDKTDSLKAIPSYVGAQFTQDITSTEFGIPIYASNDATKSYVFAIFDIQIKEGDNIKSSISCDFASTPYTEGNVSKKYYIENDGEEEITITFRRSSTGHIYIQGKTTRGYSVIFKRVAMYRFRTNETEEV